MKISRQWDFHLISCHDKKDESGNASFIHKYNTLFLDIYINIHIYTVCAINCKIGASLMTKDLLGLWGSEILDVVWECKGELKR